MRNNGHGSYAITEKYVPEQEELQQILDWGDTENKALFLCLMTTMQRVGKFLKEFKWSKYDKVKHEEYPYFYFTAMQKGKRPVKTFITPEAKQFLEEYRKQYDKIVETREARTPKVKRKKLDRDLIFPMSYRVANEKWNKMTTKARFYVIDENSGKPKTGIHVLRAYAKSNFSNENDALYFMGKTPENISTYQDDKIENLRKKYIKGSKDLTIFTTPKQTLKLVKQQNENIEKIKEERKQFRGELRIIKERNNFLNDRINDITKEYNELKLHTMILDASELNDIEIGKEKRKATKNEKAYIKYMLQLEKIKLLEKLEKL